MTSSLGCLLRLSKRYMISRMLLFNLLAVRSTIARTDMVIEESNRHSSIGYLFKKQAEEEYVFF